MAPARERGGKMGARMCKRQLPLLAYGPTYPATRVTLRVASRMLMSRVCIMRGVACDPARRTCLQNGAISQG